tara:strand:+ start:484 stop:615 length:132 start_codon:yes stop_codon:yes gene_type:complete
VSQERIDKFKSENPEFIYFETSAIERKNVEEVFKTVAENHLSI